MKSLNTQIRSSLMAACALSLLAVPATFAGNKGKHGDKFRMMDTDGDGRVSRAEHSAGARQMFTKMDVDGDGVVTAMEMDGKHDKSSMDHKRGDKHDKRHDADRSDKRAEGDDAMKREKRANAELHGYSDKPGKEMKAKDKILTIDRDGDGRLTSEEHEAGSTSMFEKMDTDHDGYLSAEEMKSGHEHMMKKH